MTDWIDLLRQAVADDPRGRAGVAVRIGFSRAAVSQALSGTYGAKTDAIARAVIDHYDRPFCDLQNRVIERPLCRRISLIPEPKGGDARVRWVVCQTCANKPKE
jgi:hypothetical protein